MNTAMVVAALGVLYAWGVLASIIRRWGPGSANHSVLCPAKQKKAAVVVEQREGNFGCLRVTDALACSLIPGGALNCNKDCLSKL